MTLAPAHLADVARAAVLSPCGRYRYLLTRTWAAGPLAAFIMLNPSTADAQRDDATIRRCLRYAADFGCAGLVVANLFGWRATHPARLRDAADPIGPDNDRHLSAAALHACAAGAPVVAAWGAHAPTDRIAAVLELPGMHRLTALALTRAGQPRHPLYLPAHLRPQPWTPPAAHTRDGNGATPGAAHAHPTCTNAPNQ